VGWACATANVADNTFQWLIRRVCPTFYTWRFEQGCAAHDASRDP
jgi:hypothetical protein